MRALLMGAVTTACAFLALGVSSMPALREVGILGAIGIVSAAGFAVIVLPALAGKPRAAGSAIVDMRAHFAKLSAHTGRGLLTVALFATLPLAYGVTKVHLDGDVANLSSLSEESAADDLGIKETWGEAFRATQVVVPGKDFQTALTVNRSLENLLERAKGAGSIRDFSSVSSILPTVAEQTSRLAAWRNFWSDERVSQVRSDLAAACDELGFEAATFAPFFAWIESDPEVLEYSLEGEGPLASLLRDRVLRMGDDVLITTQVFVRDWAATERLKAELRGELPQAVVISSEALSYKLAAMVVGELWKLGSCAFLAVVVIVLLWLRSIRSALLVIIPLAFSSVWTLGALGWLGISINLANSVFAAFLFGIAVDYAIFMVQVRLDRARGEDEDVAETDSSVMLCAVTTCIGFGALVAAEHPVLHSIGATALTGIVAAFLATRIFVPWLSDALLKPSDPES
ncbi:MAG: putative RND superfamily exporter protein [Planctomycetota bacterium]